MSNQLRDGQLDPSTEKDFYVDNKFHQEAYMEYMVDSLQDISQPQNRKLVLKKPMPKLWLKLQEGEIITDSSINANHGFPYGNPTYSSSSIALSGSGQNVTITNPTIFDGLTKCTISLWAKQTTLTAAKALLGRWDNSKAQIFFGTSSTVSSQLCFWIATNLSDNGSTGYATTPTSSWVSDGNFHHVVMVFDGTQGTNAGKLKVYIDNVPQTLTFTGNMPTVMTTETVATNLILGSYSTGIVRNWNGSLKEVQIFNDAKTTTEIAQLFALQRLTTNLIGAWYCTDVYGNYIDSSNNYTCIRTSGWGRGTGHHYTYSLQANANSGGRVRFDSNIIHLISTKKDWTITFWEKLVSGTFSYNTIALFRNGSPLMGLGIDHDNTTQCRIRLDTETAQNQTKNCGQLNDYAWHLRTIAYSAWNRTFYLYLDKTLIATWNNWTGDFDLAKYPTLVPYIDTMGKYVNIEDFRIYDFKLDQTQVNAVVDLIW
jgi:hypothetical protein